MNKLQAVIFTKEFFGFHTGNGVKRELLGMNNNLFYQTLELYIYYLLILSNKIYIP